MAVSKRTNAAGKTIYRYDFQFDGVRVLSEDPHYPTEAKAKAAEAQHRKRLRRTGVAPRSAKGSAQADSAPAAQGSSLAPKIIVTLAQACARYWVDVAQHHRSASDIERRLEICKRLIGADKDIRAIRTATVIDAVQARMKEAKLTRYGKPSADLITGAGANRDVIDTLRPVLNHAGAAFEEDGLELPKGPDWKRARQPEADEIVCEFSDAEIDAWSAQLRGEPERIFLQLALTYGPRLGELHFPPKAFRPDAQEGPELELGAYIGKGGVVRTSRKDRSLHQLPLTIEDAELIAPLVDQAKAIGAATIWLERDKAGDLQRISYDAMRGRLLRAARRAGIDQARAIHGMRHHAGERMERIGGIGRVQQLLGHKQITTSRRYARGSKGALRGNLDEILRKKSRPSPAQAPPGGSGPSL